MVKTSCTYCDSHNSAQVSLQFTGRGVPKTYLSCPPSGTLSEHNLLHPISGFLSLFTQKKYSHNPTLKYWNGVTYFLWM